MFTREITRYTVVARNAGSKVTGTGRFDCNTLGLERTQTRTSTNSERTQTRTSTNVPRLEHPLTQNTHRPRSSCSAHLYGQHGRCGEAVVRNLQGVGGDPSVLGQQRKNHQLAKLGGLVEEGGAAVVQRKCVHFKTGQHVVL